MGKLFLDPSFLAVIIPLLLLMIFALAIPFYISYSAKKLEAKEKMKEKAREEEESNKFSRSVDEDNMKAFLEWNPGKKVGKTKTKMSAGKSSSGSWVPPSGKLK